MKFFTILLYLIALIVGAFGYWGIFTKAGRREYDEMAGIIPGFALLISAILFLVAIILSIVLYFKTRKRKRSAQQLLTEK